VPLSCAHAAEALAATIAIRIGIRIRRGVIGSLYLPERSMKQASRDKRDNRNRLISDSHCDAPAKRHHATGAAVCAGPAQRRAQHAHRDQLERFRAKWTPVRVKKTRQTRE
jgi:hypothetical protein